MKSQLLTTRKRVGKRLVTRGATFYHVHAPLAILGVSAGTIFTTGRRRRRGISYPGLFWDRYADRLPEILHEAHQCYRRAMKRAHSDLAGGSHEQSVLLNAAWRRVKYLFGKHGCELGKTL